MAKSRSSKSQSGQKSSKRSSQSRKGTRSASKEGSTRNIRSASPPASRGEHAIELIARGVWRHGSRILMCRNLKKDYLYLPGGHIEFSESAASALEREFLEECGKKVRTQSLALVTEATFTTKKRWHHELNLVFLVEPASAATGSTPPTIRSQEPHIGFEWVDFAAAVDLDIRPLAIKAWLAAGANPTTATAEWISEVSV